MSRIRGLLTPNLAPLNGGSIFSNMDSDLIPGLDATYNLGSTLFRWLDLFLSNTLYFTATSNQFNVNAINYSFPTSTPFASNIVVSEGDQILNARYYFTADMYVGAMSTNTNKTNRILAYDYTGINVYTMFMNIVTNVANRMIYGGGDAFSNAATSHEFFINTPANILTNISEQFKFLIDSSGIKIPNGGTLTGYTASYFAGYMKVTGQSIIFTGIWASNQTINYSAVRSGDVVVFTLQSNIDVVNATIANQITNTIAIPAIFRPAYTTYESIRIIDNGTISTGNVIFSTGGFLTISPISGSNFAGISASGPSGFYARSWTYIGA